VPDLCRQLGCSEASFYLWKKRYGNLGITEIRELRQLRDENARLKRVVADLPPDKHILSEVVRKKLLHDGESWRTGSVPAIRSPWLDRVGWPSSREPLGTSAALRGISLRYGCGSEISPTSARGSAISVST